MLAALVLLLAGTSEGRAAVCVEFARLNTHTHTCTCTHTCTFVRLLLFQLQTRGLYAYMHKPVVRCPCRLF
jgi:hypothetical protein